ncbi:MAG: DUF1080 domain-containing protein [Opitutaceae bacterium]|nr:DUF1080 domain-containing protein [Opitutaceae bacterium]
MRFPTCGLVLFALVSSLSLAADESWISLWNGRDLGEWTTWMRKPERTSNVPGAVRLEDGSYRDPLGDNHDPLQVFSVVQVDGAGAIRISGEVFGELRTRRSFENYHLTLQFKWGEKKWPPRDQPETPRDSGLLYHVHAAPGAEGRVWARSIELQIQEHDVGDLYAVGSMIYVRSRLQPGSGKAGTRPIYHYDPNGSWVDFAQIPGMEGRCVKSPDNERPRGEWNTVELYCLGHDAIHVVNGKVVMRLHGPRRIDTATPQPVTSGPLILQSEGAEIFYRNLRLRPITALPDGLGTQ